VHHVGQRGTDLQQWLNTKAAELVRERGPGGRFPENSEFAEKTLTWVRRLACFMWKGNGLYGNRDDFAGGIIERAIRYFHTFNNKADYTAWLYRIATNFAKTLRKSAANATPTQTLDCNNHDEIEAAHLQKQHGQPQRAVMDVITGRIYIEQMLAQLSPVNAAVAREVLQNDRDLTEIARDLGVKASTVRVRFNRAIRQLSEIRSRTSHEA